MPHYTEVLSDTESEKEQYPETPVEEVTLEKPKRTYKKRVKPDTPDTPANTPDTPEPKPKRVLSEEHKEKMRLAREASKIRRAKAEEEAKEEAKPVEDKPEDKPVEPPKKKGRPKKVDVVKEDVKEVPVKDKVIEVHHHHYEKDKPKKEKKEPVKKERVKKEKKEPPTPKTVMPSIDFV